MKLADCPDINIFLCAGVGGVYDVGGDDSGDGDRRLAGYAMFFDGLMEMVVLGTMRASGSMCGAHDYTELTGGVGMASSVALSEAQQHLGELLERAEHGEEILIEREGRPAMKLVPVFAEEQIPARRIGGQNLLGITYIAPDFDAPMSDEEL